MHAEIFKYVDNCIYGRISQTKPTVIKGYDSSTEHIRAVLSLGAPYEEARGHMADTIDSPCRRKK